MTTALNPPDVVRKLWAHDPSLWTLDEAVAGSIRNRLGWLNVAAEMRRQLPELRSFADAVREAGIRDVVLLGMGGSSLAPEVLAAVFGSAAGYPRLTVLDSTDPDAVANVRTAINPNTTLFIVATKSGTTTETLSFFGYFWEQTVAAVGESAGDHFVAITDPGTPLVGLAESRQFRGVFLNPPDIGGRYSALSLFGLVPAALIGAPLEEIIDGAVRSGAEWSTGGLEHETHPVSLGIALAGHAAQGRNKLTLLTTGSLAGFGDWVEQLVAESTGKHGVGIVPIVGEPVGGADAYGDDRVFVQVSVDGDDVTATTAELAALEQAGHPVYRWSLSTPSALGSEFLKWEIATAVAGACFGINPFDEPNVQESKDNTTRLLSQYIEHGALPEPAPTTVQGAISVYSAIAPPSVGDALQQFLESVAQGSYVAILAYVEMTAEIEDALLAVRTEIRDRLRLATTVGFGPRYLHSTGQLHKGGPPIGAFIQITAEDADDIAVPGQPYSFGVLKQAQALGDNEALRGRGLPILRLHLSGDSATGLASVHAAVRVVAGDQSFTP